MFIELATSKGLRLAPEERNVKRRLLPLSEASRSAGAQILHSSLIYKHSAPTERAVTCCALAAQG
jgi:hypothetical protein